MPMIRLPGHLPAISLVWLVAPYAVSNELKSSIAGEQFKETLINLSTASNQWLNTSSTGLWYNATFVGLCLNASKVVTKPS